MVSSPTKNDKLFWLDMDFWPCFVGFCDKPKHYFKFLKELGATDDHYLPDHADAAVKALYNGGKRIYLLLIDRDQFAKYSKTERTGLLAHECVHILQEMRESIGDLGSEGEAYTMQRILMSAMTWEKSRRKRGKPEIEFSEDVSSEQASLG